MHKRITKQVTPGGNAPSAGRTKGGKFKKGHPLTKLMARKGGKRKG